jgi:hypothetical protein
MALGLVNAKGPEDGVTDKEMLIALARSLGLRQENDSSAPLGEDGYRIEEGHISLGYGLGSAGCSVWFAIDSDGQCGAHGVDFIGG